MTPRHVARSARLLLQAGFQHLVDDPAVLAVQLSRRTPLRVRSAAGAALAAVGARVPGGCGAAALGAVMAGEPGRAAGLLERRTGAGRRAGRLGGEVALLLDREDLLPPDAPAPTRARAAWRRGDLGTACALLDEAGLGATRGARRLRSERRLLRPGHRLPVPAGPAAPAGVDTAPSAPAPTIPGPSIPGERLRVLHLLTNSLPHTASGYALRTHRILTALAEQGVDSLALTRTGYPVLVGRVGAAPEDVVDGVRYVRTLPARLPQTPEERLVAEVERALELVAAFRPHVLHATTPYPNALVAQAVSGLTGLPWVYEVRGMAEQTWIASHPTPEGRRAAARSEKAHAVATREGELARQADAVVTLSGAMAAELTRRGVPAEGVVRIPNGVNASLLEERLSPAEARRRLGVPVPEDALAVGAVSALVEYEGFDVLLRAVALLRADPTVPAAVRERVHVVLAGDGTAAPALAALAAELGLADRVHLPGRVPPGAARTWVQALDVVAVPRLDLEVTRTVTPQKPIEALALGRPVVISDLPPLRETVTGEDGSVHAVLVQAGSAPVLAAVLARQLARPRSPEAAARGRALAARRTWPALVQRHRAVYRDVLEPAAGPVTEGAGDGR